MYNWREVKLMKKRTIARQFKLPLDEDNLNSVYNNENAIIIDEKVFQDRNGGDVIVFLKYEIEGGEEPITVKRNKIDAGILGEFDF